MSRIILNQTEFNRAVKTILTLPVISSTGAIRDSTDFTCPSSLLGDAIVRVIGDQAVIVDEQHCLIDPLCGIESVDLVEQLAMPSMRPDARFLLVSVDYGCQLFNEYWYLHFPALPKEQNCFLIAQRNPDSAPFATATDGWQQIRPELSTQSSSYDVKTNWCYWHLAGRGLEAWLIPVGLFNIPKNPEHLFYDPYCKAREFTADAIAIFENARNRFLGLYHAAEGQLEIRYEQSALTKCAKSVNLAKVCAQLNERLYSISQQEGFANVRQFVLSPEEDKERPFAYGKHLRTASEAEIFVRKMEMKVSSYQTYLPKFMRFRERVEALGGTINYLTSTSVVVVAFPRSEVTEEDESPHERRQFTFSEVGLAAFTTWLKENNQAYQAATSVNKQASQNETQS